jgi:hypothetical protein
VVVRPERSMGHLEIGTCKLTLVSYTTDTVRYIPDASLVAAHWSPFHVSALDG